MLIFNKNKLYTLSVYTKFSKTKFLQTKFNFFLGQNNFFFFFNIESFLLNLKLISLLLQKTTEVFFISTEPQFDSIIRIAALNCKQSFLTSKECIQSIFSNNNQSKNVGFYSKNTFIKKKPSLVIIASLSKNNLIIQALKKANIIVIGFIAFNNTINGLDIILPGSNKQSCSKILIYFFSNFISNFIKLHSLNN